MIEAALKQYISELPNQITGIQQAQETLAKGHGKDFETVFEKLRDKISNKQ